MQGTGEVCVEVHQGEPREGKTSTVAIAITAAVTATISIAVAIESSSVVIAATSSIAIPEIAIVIAVDTTTATSNRYSKLTGHAEQTVIGQARTTIPNAVSLSRSRHGLEPQLHGVPYQSAVHE